MTDTMRLAEDERAELLDLLTGLTAEQWEAPTLCTGWCVRDVVTHVVSYDELNPLGAVGAFLRGGFRFGRVNQLRIDAYADRSPDELITLFKACLHPRGITAGRGGRIALCDGMIHQQDIRRPLGLPRTIPAERMIATLDFARTVPLIHAPKRIRDLTLAATDLDWTTGTGPRVEGPAEALLMAIAGRSGITDELTGPGLPTLAQRIGG
ncbi:maleylpyruvate isomerase family mycothiol-dependent enzyme [Cryptosporangium sp. NPDC051539]|uniref:maleylpyruvate isomerase family mycothiol-dependent enzyme n=1 Tax=Cryptosporangium sp. NPDC051539 TaxID=3363962 RepID=UPI0037A3DBFF